MELVRALEAKNKEQAAHVERLQGLLRGLTQKYTQLQTDHTGLLENYNALNQQLQGALMTQKVVIQEKRDLLLDRELLRGRLISAIQFNQLSSKQGENGNVVSVAPAPRQTDLSHLLGGGPTVATPEVANDAAGQLLRLKSPPSSLPHPDKVSDSDEENKATVNEVEGGTREPIGPCRNPVTDAKYTKQVGKFSFHVAKRHSDTRCEQWAAPHAKRSRVDNVEQAHSLIHKKEDSSDDLSEASQSVDNNVENEEEELLI